jgi:hypothetical protein
MVLITESLPAPVSLWKNFPQKFNKKKFGKGMGKIPLGLEILKNFF